MNKHELLVEVLRGEEVESYHYGAAVVCDAEGNIMKSWGDPHQVVFPRSALKHIQALALVESGAAEYYNFKKHEIALVCASHSAEDIHTKTGLEILRRIGLCEDDLICGAPKILKEPTASILLKRNERPTKIHNNCSGKHIGVLATTVFQKEDIRSYYKYAHPVQQHSIDILTDLAEIDVRKYPYGEDGCGFPIVTMPLKNLALCMANFAVAKTENPKRKEAIFTVQQAITENPYHIAGTMTTVSDIIAVTNGKVLAKTGAEGIYTANIPEKGIGIAVKIADGSIRARSVLILAIIDQLGIFTDDEREKLKKHMSPVVTNTLNHNIGSIRLAKSFYK